MKVAIAPEAQHLFPALGVICLAISGLRESPRLREAAEEAVRLAEKRMEAIADYEAVASLAEIQGWREAARTMGLRPAEYRSSIEALMRMWTAGRRPESGDATIDLYNRVSIAERAPLGAVDAARLPAAAGMVLRIARPEVDSFQAVSGSVAMKAGANAVSYCLENEIICYALNHRDSALFGIGPQTDAAIFFSEWTNAAQESRSRAAIARLAGMFAEAGAAVGPVTYASGSRGASAGPG